MKIIILGSLLSILTYCSFALAGSQNAHEIFQKNAGFMPKQSLPVLAVDELPWFWKNYNGGTTPFESETFKKVIGEKSPEQILTAIIKANNDDKVLKDITTVNKFKIQGGTLYVVFDFYYVTVDEAGEMVSFMIEGEERGVYPPEMPNVYPSDDLLCFFKGPRKNTCAYGDDT